MFWSARSQSRPDPQRTGPRSWGATESDDGTQGVWPPENPGAKPGDLTGATARPNNEADEHEEHPGSRLTEGSGVMATSRIIEEESGIYRSRRIHRHNGYYAGDFSAQPPTSFGLARPAASRWRDPTTVSGHFVPRGPEATSRGR